MVETDDGALKLIIDALDESKRAVNSLNARLYIQQETRRVAEYRAEQLAQALRSVCMELLQERGCYEGECGTDACSYSDCVVGPAMELLESLEREVPSGE